MKSTLLILPASALRAFVITVVVTVLDGLPLDAIAHRGIGSGLGRCFFPQSLVGRHSRHIEATFLKLAVPPGETLSPVTAPLVLEVFDASPPQPSCFPLAPRQCGAARCPRWSSSTSRGQSCADTGNHSTFADPVDRPPDHVTHDARLSLVGCTAALEVCLPPGG